MAASKTADLVVINANILTLNHRFDLAEAMAVSRGRVVAVGANDQIRALIGPQARVLDLAGQTVAPGINDSHLHAAFFGGTREPLALNLAYPAIKSMADITKALRQAAAGAEPGEWIRGFGWDVGYLEECKADKARLPTRKDLDSASPDNPVLFTDFSGHLLWVNSKALTLAGVTKETPNPPSGELVRDPQTGEPTGLFKELAAQGLIHRAVPLLTKAEKREAILSAMKKLNSLGITSYTEAALGPGGDAFCGGLLGAECIEVYQDLHAEGALTARVNILLLFGDYGSCSLSDIEQGLAGFEMPQGLNPEWLKIAGVKIFADGIPPAQTAWMYQPYVGGGVGSLCVPGQSDEEKHRQLVKMIVHAHKQGFQVGVHATGDRAIDAVFDGFVKGAEEKPGGDPRHYVIHGDFITPQSIQRAAKYNFGVNMQPGIKSTIADLMDQVVGAERSAYQWPLRTALDAGVNVVASSDAPVTYPDWRQGVQDAVLRESKASGRVSGPQERVSAAEALRLYTLSGAWQDHLEKIKGSLEAGKAADFCVLDQNILTIDPHDIRNVKVVMTVVGGQIVFEG